MKKIAIILLNYKSKHETIECVSSLAKINHKGYELQIVVVDNSPHDSEYYLKTEISKHRSVPCELIESQNNTGFTGGNNIGIAHALANGFNYILILNNDTIVDKDFLENLLTEAEKNKNCGILVPKIYFASGHEFHKKRYTKKDLGNVIWYAGGTIDWKNIIGHHRGVDEVDTGQFDKSESTEYATGACMLIKREVIEKVGMFDEKYFLYYEDADLSMRSKKAGWQITYVPKSKIWHKNASSTGGSGSNLQDYYITRNRLLFAKRYAPLRSRAALLRESLKLLRSGRKYQKKGVEDYYKKKFGKAHFEIE